eukprot:CAMPEP_0194366356 /NCGR_PEP_ID=MMETSP0174-20130528/14392_1 /TAXON_ID=216777 /ORGANISM="Proboscia alata, Strain PI-D3" /LENGTH=467 /DNA_ID=CAMNT_0039141493 /DNA_START=64 /DNA_END=1467 /DNA_ORIENTATION=-
MGKELTAQRNGQHKDQVQDKPDRKQSHPVKVVSTWPKKNESTDQGDTRLKRPAYVTSDDDSTDVDSQNDRWKKKRRLEDGIVEGGGVSTPALCTSSSFFRFTKKAISSLTASSSICNRVASFNDSTRFSSCYGTYYALNSKFSTTPHPLGLVKVLPSDILGHCLSYLNGLVERPNIVRISRAFRDWGDGVSILQNLDLSDSKKHFLSTEDTANIAKQRLSKFVSARNPHALYMLGMIECYCFEKVTRGVELLHKAAFALSKDESGKDCKPHLPSLYTLGLILRDCDREKSESYLRLASRFEHLGALHETLTPDEMKQLGVHSTEELKMNLDSIQLHELISREYHRNHRALSSSAAVSNVQHCIQHIKELADDTVPQIWNDLKQTSYCFNPRCGRWAYKIQKSFMDQDDEDNMTTPPSESGDGGKCVKVARMKMCSSCRTAKYCSKLCQVYDWRSERHRMECRDWSNV